MFAPRVNALGNNATSEGWGERDLGQNGHLLFIENCAEAGFGEGLLKNSELRTVEERSPIVGWNVCNKIVKRPDLDLRHFKRIEDVHGNGIGALIGEVPANVAENDPEIIIRKGCVAEVCLDVYLLLCVRVAGETMIPTRLSSMRKAGLGDET